MQRRGPTWLLMMLAVLAATLSPWVQSQDKSAEYKVKAAFLYKFAAYVEWPPAVFTGDGTPLVIGVQGSDAMYRALAGLTGGQSVQGHPLQVLDLDHEQRPAVVHILFAGSSQLTAERELRLPWMPASTLVVTEDARLPAAGIAMISFAVVDDHVNFDVALPPAQRAGLKLSARLLQVARNVVQQP